MEQLAEHGFSGLTIEKICAAAGVPRATFYRRWPTAAAAVSDAFNARFESGVLETTGDLQRDLEAFAAKLMALYNDPLLGPCLLFILTESKLRPELTAHMGEVEVARRKRNMTTLSQALQDGGYRCGVSARLILAGLNGMAQSTYLSNRKFAAADFREFIAQLLRPADTRPAEPG